MTRPRKEDVEPKRTLKQERQNRKQGRTLSVFDGSFYAVMVGLAESFYSVFAILLKATDVQLGLLGSLPQFLGSLAQLFSNRLVKLFGTRKRLVVTGASLQGLMLIPIGLVFLAGRFSVVALIATVSAYFIFGLLVSPAWGSWMGDLVEENERGIYFGKRNKVVGTITFLAFLGGGLILQIFQDNQAAYSGFLLLFGIALLARVVSISFLIRQHEPCRPPEQEERDGFISFLKGARRTNYGLLVLFLSAMNFAVYLASPFFAAYMLDDLRMSYFTFTIVTAAALGVKYALMPVWGKAADKYGARKVLVLSAAMMPLVPVLWLFSTQIWYLLLIQAYSGFVWAGLELTSFTFLLDTAEPRRRTSLLAYYNVLNGTFIFLGAVLGGLLVSYNHVFWSSYLLVFLVSGLLRAAVMVVYLPRLKEIRQVRRISYERLLFHVISVGPTMGAIHRLEIQAPRPLKPLVRGLALPFTVTGMLLKQGFYPVEQALRRPLPKPGFYRVDRLLEASSGLLRHGFYPVEAVVTELHREIARGDRLIRRGDRKNGRGPGRKRRKSGKKSGKNE